MNPRKINDSNYKKYFRITDLEQGRLGKFHVRKIFNAKAIFQILKMQATVGLLALLAVFFKTILHLNMSFLLTILLKTLNILVPYKCKLVLTKLKYFDIFSCLKGAFHFRFWIYGTFKDVVVGNFLYI